MDNQPNSLDNQPIFLKFGGVLVTALQHAINSTLNKAFDIQTRYDEWSVGRHTPPMLKVQEASAIKIRQMGEPYGVFVAAFSRDLILRVVKKYNPCDQYNGKIIEDAAGEITNMIYGGFKASMNKMGHRLEMNLPIPVYENDQLFNQCQEAERIIQPYYADGFLCQIVIAKACVP